MKEQLRGFQKRFVRGALAPGIDVAALSIPRGNGKPFLAAHILQRALTPGDVLHVPAAEYLLCAGSIEQARLCFRFIRAELEPSGEYRFIDSATRIGITHKASNTRLRVLSSNGKTAFGIVGCPLLVADEPGSWEDSGWHSDVRRDNHGPRQAAQPHEDRLYWNSRAVSQRMVERPYRRWQCGYHLRPGVAGQRRGLGKVV